MGASIERGSFAGHETFPFRYTWLRKAAQFVEGEPTAFTREDAMVELGVGKNMVRSIRHWALVAGVLEEDPSVPNNRGAFLRRTDLARRLLSDRGWDPYLEDPATTWLLHWQIASVPENATTWYWVFNHLPQPEFSKSDLLRWLKQLATDGGWSRVAPSSLRRDIDCFLRSYVPARISRGVSIEDTLDCPLIDLGLIQELGDRGTYILNRGDHPTLPDAIVAYALVDHIRKRLPGSAKTVPLEAVAFAPGSPGRAFCLTEDALLLRFERLRETTDGALSFDETAGMKQILVNDLPEPNDLLAAHYGARTARSGRA